MIKQLFVNLTHFVSLNISWASIFSPSLKKIYFLEISFVSEIFVCAPIDEIQNFDSINCLTSYKSYICHGFFQYTLIDDIFIANYNRWCSRFAWFCSLYSGWTIWQSVYSAFTNIVENNKIVPAYGLVLTLQIIYTPYHFCSSLGAFPIP